MNKSRSFVAAAIVCLLGTSWLSAQAPTCEVVFQMVNRNRAVLAPNQGVHITAECGEWDFCIIPIYHDPPYGNWGVSSNVGRNEDGDQFQGWKPKQGHMQWNSCTTDFPPPDCSKYNSNNCTQQVTVHGINTHGSVTTLYSVECPRVTTDWTWIRGCKEIEGLSVTLSQNFMTLYEKDWPDAHDLIQSMIFPNLAATLGGCDAWSCAPAGSSWVSPTSYNTPTWPPLVDAQMAITVIADILTNPPYGDCDDWNCADPCDPGGWCPPCTPSCFGGICF